MFGRVKDPVCGMKVKKKAAAATAEYQGTTYYFCAVGCKERFEQEPAKYLGQREQIKAETNP